MLLHISLKLLVKSKTIPSNPRIEVGIDLQQPIIYVLLHNSTTDLITLRTECLQQGLPDPLVPLSINGITLPRYVFIYDKPRVLSWFKEKPRSITLFNDYLNLCRLNPQLDIQIILVLIMFGRSPGKEGQSSYLIPPQYFLKSLGKFLAILWLGRDSFIHFSNPLSMRHIITKYGTNKIIIQKLMHIARIHFARQHLVVVGPQLPVRHTLFNKLLASNAIEKAVEDEASSKKISKDKAQQNAIILMEEIAANVSYEAIRLSDRVLSWTWNRLYQGLHVRNADRVQQLSKDGHEIVYIPCHRSHMDYLLLSYVLYHNGLVPPHIAAGINLNFWPAGPIFRRLGAFFIRRSFKGNKLYSTIFREYLGELFSRGYSVEYFMEGGRSRTGRLLDPKTGMLTMTIQAMLRGGNRPITLVPIYVGYEHVMEVPTYAKELRGAIKEKEGLVQMVRGLRKLRNLGQGYVNFGEPLLLSTWLNQEVPQWRAFINHIEIQRPGWLVPAADKVASMLMVRINNAAATNAINLCSSILLAARQRSLNKLTLLAQLKCYIELLRNVPYAKDVTLPDFTPEDLLNHALAMNKFTIKQKDTINSIIFLSQDQAILMTYYRNNIQHLLVLPSLVANIVKAHSGICRERLIKYIMLLYPFLKAELFMHFEMMALTSVINRIIDELYRQRLIQIDGQHLLPIMAKIHAIELLAANVKEPLQRYIITLYLLGANPQINRSTLEKESCIIAQQLSAIHGINAPEFSDKAVFSTLISTLRSEGYISNSGDIVTDKVANLYSILSELLSPEVLITIQNASLLTGSTLLVRI